MTQRAPTAAETEFHERMHAAHMYGLWELASQMTRHPEPKAIPYMWRSSLLEAVVRESGEAVPVGEERRALQLFNPGLEGRWATTNTMIAAVQLLLPGETARAHRHTPVAIRFIMEGDGAYTAVDGERVYMAPGDLVLTPSWAWHDHGNETDRPVVWMDGLDIPLVQFLNSMFFQLYEDREFPLTRPHNASTRLHAHAGLSPTWVKERPQSSPLLLYAWDKTWGSLDALRHAEGDPSRRHRARVHAIRRRAAPCCRRCPAGSRCSAPASACAPIATPAAPSTTSSRAPARPSSTAVASTGGRATSSRCRPGRSTSTPISPARDDAVLFSIQDRPVIEALGLYREEPYADNGGHQRVISSFAA